MEMRPGGPVEECGFSARHPKEFAAGSASIGLRLEFIAILSGGPLAEAVPATSCDAISPGGELLSADESDAVPGRRSRLIERCPGKTYRSAWSSDRTAMAQYVQVRADKLSAIK